MNLKDHFLIAMPSLDCGTFRQSVVYICEHESTGAVGIMANRLAHCQMDEILDHLSIECHCHSAKLIEVLMGGPVDQEHGFVVHSPVGHWDASLKVAPQLAMTASSDIIHAIAQGEGPDEFLFALGYSSWDNNQLEEEIAKNDWLTLLATPELLFEVPVTKRYEHALKLLGIDSMHQLSTISGHD